MFISKQVIVKYTVTKNSQYPLYYTAGDRRSKAKRYLTEYEVNKLLDVPGVELLDLTHKGADR